ncbi:MAG: HDIG domain-containing protein [Deltaproteobacteria bacterium]|nr:HDIG domain-containing protein [Deltaproteobacteria bacterium]
MRQPDTETSKPKAPHFADDADKKPAGGPTAGNVILVLATALTATLLFTPSIHKLDLPVADTDIGKVSTANIRADRDYTIVDEEATEKARAEAATQVRSVYFHEMDVAETIAGRVREAFGLARAAVEQYQRDVLGMTDGGIPDADGSGIEAKAPQKQKKTPKQVKAKGAEDPALTAHLFEQKAEFVKTMQVPVDDGDFGVLARAAFAKEIEDGLLSLVHPVMQEMLVQSKDLLAAERHLGITVQRISAREQSVITDVKSIDAIKDLDEARRVIGKKADFILAEIPRDQRAAIVMLSRKLIVPNLIFKKDLTENKKEEVRERVIPVTTSLKKGQMIVRDGDKLEKRHLMIFRGVLAATKDSRDILISFGMFCFSILIIVAPYRFARSFVRKFAPKPRDIVLMQILLIASMLLGKLFVLMGGAIADQSRWIPFRAFQYLIPLAAGAMMCRFVLNSESALVFAMVNAMFAGLLVDGNLWYAGYAFVGSIVAAHGVAQATQRTTVLRAGTLTGGVNALVVLALAMFQADAAWTETAIAVVFALSSGLLSAMIVTAFTPAIEVLFGYITDVKLLELANLNHPLLKELIVQAPGTYHHSIVVGSLVESAAEAIHANPLLARVTAYYHDIGKIKNPLYFGENQKDGLNRHDKLKPSMSALVIKSHVKDGIEIAKNHRLGQPILDIVAQHHGTALIKYFFQKARAQAGAGEIIEELDYRYPGPKPQTREAALVMLADAVEAAAKSVPDLDQVRLRGLVQKIINNFFRDQQLSECDLTLKDLHKIAAAFIRVLEGIYHQRPEYHEPAVKVSDEKTGKGHENGEARDGAAPKAKPPAHPPGAVPDEGDEGEYDEDFRRLGL